MSQEADYYQRLQLLVNGLTDRTRKALEADEPLWERSGDAYQLTLKRSSMRIFSRDGDDQSPYIFELYDAKGNLVDSVVDDPFEVSIVGLGELYTLVSQGERLKARDAALDDALRELDLEEPPSE